MTKNSKKITKKTKEISESSISESENESSVSEQQSSSEEQTVAQEKEQTPKETKENEESTTTSVDNESEESSDDESKESEKKEEKEKIVKDSDDSSSESSSSEEESDADSESSEKEEKKKVDDSKERTLFIKGFDRDYTEIMLEQKLEKFGEIVSVRMPRDRQRNVNKGFAYVEFKNKKSAEKVLQHKDNLSLGLDAVIDVPKEKTESTGKTIFVKNLPYICEADSVKEYFSQFAPIKNIRLPRDYEDKTRIKGFAFLEVEEEDVKKILGKKHVFEERDLTVQLSNPNRGNDRNQDNNRNQDNRRDRNFNGRKENNYRNNRSFKNDYNSKDKRKSENTSSKKNRIEFSD
ncbi:RNA binding protein [Spraguea lophii 42_110]|uniref:RNA binding protein n=1 Tax=Spraguea lophii (strain 42_110) TaxID=1358809 RepID=S7W7K1_SPRLO|nr:RNA binding protein [Spraguea lophii 42_110]